MRQTLVILTHWAPYVNAENAFLMPELPTLAKSFSRIIIVPDKYSREVKHISLPDGVCVDEENTRRRNIPRWRHLVWGFLSFKWLRERVCSSHQFACALEYISRVHEYRNVIKRCIKRNAIDVKESLFYSFWMTEESSALAELSLNNKDIAFVTRAHGYDLYDYRVGFRSRYYRELTLKLAKYVCCCSHDGVLHLEANYPVEGANIGFSYLGIGCAGVAMPPTPDFSRADTVRLVTVARLVPIKQHVRFIKELIAYAKNRQAISIVYDIIGNGPEEVRIRSACRDSVPNLAINMLGAMPNVDVLRRYANVPYDLFVLPSKSEGLSVAAMEAMARGIPALVTKVGGMPELVQDRISGVVVPPNFDSKDLLGSLDFYLACDRQALRGNAWQHIRESFDVDKTRSEFCSILRNLASTTQVCN